MKNKKTRISQAFQRWLLALVAIAFLATTAFLWLIQTRLSEKNAISLLELNLSDVREDIIDASDEKLLNLARSIADDLNGMDRIASGDLPALIAKYDVTEINVIDDRGIIIATTYPDFWGYNMASGAQSSEFMVLLNGKSEHVQSYQPVSYDASISGKYGGAVLEGGGFV